MADAVKRLFPTAQIDVGRSDHSQKFQYDFRVERPFTPEDLERIEKEMGTIVAENASFSREAMTREEAKALFRSRDEDLKLSRLEDIPEDEAITVFRHGDFADLCRGPHVQRAEQIGAWKLLEVAGSYWRGDESNPMLQRIYGTAFATRTSSASRRPAAAITAASGSRWSSSTSIRSRRARRSICRRASSSTTGSSTSCARSTPATATRR
jgi:threonyl-tRNA synthetase